MASRSGHIIYSSARGLADLEARRPMDLNSIFRMASLTKPIASVCVLALVDAGLIDLEEDIRRYLPAFSPMLGSGEVPTITIRHLLTHTSGLTYDFLQPPTGSYWAKQVSSGLDQPGLTLSEQLARANAVPLVAMPGTAFNYSISTDILGAAVMSVTHGTLDEAFLRFVLGPLGMYETGFVPTDNSRVTQAYFNHEGALSRMGPSQLVANDISFTSFSPDRWRDPKSFQSAGAGLLGTASDYLTFLVALLQGGSPILSPNKMNWLAENAIGDLEVDPANPGWGFSLGFSVLRDRVSVGTPQANGSWSWGGAYGHSWFVDPSQELAVVALTNTAMEGVAGQFPLEVRNAFY
nr:hypothetical protein A4A59_12085 [Rhizobium leguminosarum]